MLLILIRKFKKQVLTGLVFPSPRHFAWPPAPSPGPRFISTGPVPQLVFTDPDRNFAFTDPGS